MFASLFLYSLPNSRKDFKAADLFSPRKKVLKRTRNFSLIASVELGNKVPVFLNLVSHLHEYHSPYLLNS